MAEISKSDVEHVAKLARIEITEEEKTQFTQELGAILDYMSELDKAHTENIEPISQIGGLENIVRDDNIIESYPRGKMLENAPNQQDGFIKVKKVFE